MQVIQYACEYKPQGIKSYILSSTLPYAALWQKEQRRRVAYLPQKMQNAIAEADRTWDYSSKEYQEAEGEFMLRHCVGTEAYITAWGNNEFSPSGTLKNFDFMKEIEDIKEHLLLCN